MPSQVLVLKPESELVFRGPFDRVVTSVLRLRNPTPDQVAFKVKTTAPRRYCVRPNSGLLQPGGEVEVAVMLQPPGDQGDQQSAERARHKFMVQSLLLLPPAASVKSTTMAAGELEEAWRNATPDRLMDSKLRVVLADAPQRQPSQASQPQGSVATASAANADIASLREELLRLREENARLTDQEQRLRKVAMRPGGGGGGGGPTDSSGVTGGGGGGGYGGSATARAAGPAIPPALFLVLTALLGLIIGKMLL